jgi:F-box/leucine-rich repeat protein 10/11
LPEKEDPVHRRDLLYPILGLRRRTKRKVDYTALDGGLPVFDSEKFRKLLRDGGNAEEGFSKRKIRTLEDGRDLTRAWLSENDGLSEPFIVKAKKGLDLSVPRVSVLDVVREVGRATPIEVIEVASQRQLDHWNLGDWGRYYGNFRSGERQTRDRVLNVISLEVSLTPLGPRVVPPRIVRDISFMYTSWPKARIEGGDHPRVQKYCLMSVAGSYTDFHIDFGGSSVWYHIVRGKKVFLMIPPTQQNLKAYEKWVTSDDQSEVFFPDLVPGECFRVEMRAGNTLFLPSGWIHAVFTPVDTLVFGGNYLHAFALPLQLAVSDLEDRTGLAQKYRFPSYRELHWYAAGRYLRLLKRSPDAVTPLERRNCVALAERLLAWCQSADGSGGAAASVSLEEAALSAGSRSPRALAEALLRLGGTDDASDGQEQQEKLEEAGPKHQGGTGMEERASGDGRPKLRLRLPTAALTTIKAEQKRSEKEKRQEQQRKPKRKPTAKSRIMSKISKRFKRRR